MTELPEQFFADFVSFNGDQVCTGVPVDYAPRPGKPNELMALDKGRREPCPYGNGPIVAMMSWRDRRADAFSPGLGPRQYERPLLHGHAYVVPNKGAGEVLDEAGYVEHPRVADARMMVVFDYLQLLNGTKQPICGVLFWYDDKQGIPIIEDERGKIFAAEWGETTYVQLYYP